MTMRSLLWGRQNYSVAIHERYMEFVFSLTKQEANTLKQYKMRFPTNPAVQYNKMYPKHIIHSLKRYVTFSPASSKSSWGILVTYKAGRTLHDTLEIPCEAFDSEEGRSAFFTKLSKKSMKREG